MIGPPWKSVPDRRGVAEALRGLVDQRGRSVSDAPAPPVPLIGKITEPSALACAFSSAQSSTLDAALVDLEQGQVVGRRPS